MSLKMNEEVFFAEKIAFECHWKQVMREQIDEYIDNFPGKEDFIKFYLTHNGGVFTDGAYFYPDEFYEVPKEYRFIEIASFFHIPLLDDEDEKFHTMSMEKERDLRVISSDEFTDFVLFHIPIADNYASNSFWIDIQTGEIKYMDFEENWHPDDAIVVAPSFFDFCKRIEAKFR